MFCRNCGRELKEEWKSCPFCGYSLDSPPNEKNDESNSGKAMSQKTIKPCGQTKDELKNYLVSFAFSKESGGVVLMYGASGIANDLIKVLNSEEIIEKIVHAHIISVLGIIKGSRFFRRYLVKTNQRIIYIETGVKIYSILPFLKKKLLISYPEIQSVSSDKRIGIYSGKMIIELKSNKKYTFSVIDKKTADELVENIKQKK